MAMVNVKWVVVLCDRDGGHDDIESFESQEEAEQYVEDELGSAWDEYDVKMRQVDKS